MKVSLAKPVSRFFREKLPEYVIKNNADFLTTSTITTFTLAGMGQAVAISANKKLPDDEKQFMLRQEVSTVILNLIAMFTLSRSFGKVGKFMVEKGLTKAGEYLKQKTPFKKIGNCLVSHGRFLPKIEGKSEQEVAKLTDDFFRKEKITGLISKGKDFAEKELKEIKNFQVFDQQNIEKLGNENANIQKGLNKILDQIKIDEKSENIINDFTTATTVASTVIGQILTVNLFTPILRNILASHSGNKIKTHESKEIMSKNPLPSQRIRVQEKFDSFTTNPFQDFNKLGDLS